MATTPTQRTLAELKRRGLRCAIVEKWNAFIPRPGGGMGIRQDMFGIIDIIALDFDRGVVGVQSTGQDFAGHHRKLTHEKARYCRDWLRTPGTHLELWGWRKLKKVRGKKAVVWKPRIRIYTLDDFDPLKL